MICERDADHISTVTLISEVRVVWICQRAFPHPAIDDLVVQNCDSMKQANLACVLLLAKVTIPGPFASVQSNTSSHMAAKV